MSRISLTTYCTLYTCTSIRLERNGRHIKHPSIITIIPFSIPAEFANVSRARISLILCRISNRRSNSTITRCLYRNDNPSGFNHRKFQLNKFEQKRIIYLLIHLFFFFFLFVKYHAHFAVCRKKSVETSFDI